MWKVERITGWNSSTLRVQWRVGVYMSWQPPVTRWQQLISACFKGAGPSRRKEPPKLASASNQPRWELAQPALWFQHLQPWVWQQPCLPTPCHASFHPQCHVQAEAGPGLTLPVPRHLSKPLALALAGSKSSTPHPKLLLMWHSWQRAPGQALLKATCTQMCSLSYPAAKPPQPHIYTDPCNCAHAMQTQCEPHLCP